MSAAPDPPDPAAERRRLLAALRGATDADRRQLHAALFTLCYPALVRWIAARLGGVRWQADAEQLAADVFTRGMAAADRITSPDPLPYLFTVAGTAATDWQQDRQRAAPLTGGEAAPPADADGRPSDRPTFDRFRTIVGQLREELAELAADVPDYHKPSNGAPHKSLPRYYHELHTLAREVDGWAADRAARLDHLRGNRP